MRAHVDQVGDQTFVIEQAHAPEVAALRLTLDDMDTAGRAVYARGADEDMRTLVGAIRSYCGLAIRLDPGR